MHRGYPPFNREQARCEHRTISLFCAIQCWINGWDGIRISRDQLKQLLKLKKFKSRRVEWMEEDFRGLFPYQRPYYPSPSFELSRRAFDEHTEIGDCIITERPISDNRFGLLSKRLLPTFNEAILNIFIRQITHLSFLHTFPAALQSCGASGNGQ